MAFAAKRAARTDKRKADMGSSEVLFKIFGLNVTAEVTTQWGIIAVLTLIGFLSTRKLEERPRGLQNAMELAVSKLFNFVAGMLGKEKTARFFQFFATMFIFIIVSNFIGILPGAGMLWGFKAPTSSLSVTAGLGVTVFVAVIVFGIRCVGVKRYLKHFISPVAIMLPFIIIDELVRPMSLALRLYGNIFGEETVTEELYGIFPVGPPIIMMVLSLLFCTIQAIVFTMLSAIYVDESTTIEEA